MMKAAKLGEALSGLTEVVEKEHKRLLARKSLIEKRKEEQERLLLEKVYSFWFFFEFSSTFHNYTFIIQTVVSITLKEREEESKRLKLQKIAEEAEQKRLAAEFEQRKNQRILREIEERELEEAQALLEETQKGAKKKGKKVLPEGVRTKSDPFFIFYFPVIFFSTGGKSELVSFVLGKNN